MADNKFSKRVTIKTYHGQLATFEITHDGYRVYATMLAVDGVIQEDPEPKCLMEWKHSDVQFSNDLAETIIEVGVTYIANTNGPRS